MLIDAFTIRKLKITAIALIAVTLFLQFFPLQFIINSFYAPNMINEHTEFNNDQNEKIVKEQMMSYLFQSKFHRLQNPQDCSKAKSLVCQLQGGIQGFGNIVQRMIYCFHVGFAMHRTVIISETKQSRWKYNDSWTDVFEPISETCTEEYGPIDAWPGNFSSQHIYGVYFKGVAEYPEAPPFAIPKEYFNSVQQFHKNPNIWYLAQIAKFIFRPVPSFYKELDRILREQVKNQPVVGLHVRGSDKGIKHHHLDLEVFMEYVRNFFREVEKSGKVETKYVFIATDEAKVIVEATERYPDYTFLGSTKIAESAEKSLRSTSESLKGVIIDTLALVHSDYVICTLSSNMCRVVYELRQNRYPHFNDMLVSLDFPFIFRRTKNFAAEDHPLTKFGNMSSGIEYINKRRYKKV